MLQLVGLTDSRIVMAEQTDHDVVNQTLSGGEPSPSDVPASTNDKKSAGGDVGEIKHTATTTITTQPETRTDAEQGTQSTGASETIAEKNHIGRDMEQSSTVSRDDSSIMGLPAELDIGYFKTRPRASGDTSVGVEWCSFWFRCWRGHGLSGRVGI
jgi:hypothetical protein